MIARQTLKQDIAMKLYPESISVASAMQKMRREIRETPNLKEKLKAIGGYNRHYFTKAQVELILETFAITVAEYEAI